MISKGSFIFLIIFVLLYSSLLNILGISWGIPSEQELSLIFQNKIQKKEILKEVTLELTQTRKERQSDLLLGVSYGRDDKTLVNISDDKREIARTYRRYLLYFGHPDEIISLMALSRLDPWHLKLHPHFYVYGGAFLYTLGAAIWAGAKLGFIRLTHDHHYYLQNPQEFGKFYIIGRLMVTASVLTGILFLILLTSRLFGRKWGIIAGLLFASTPGIVVMSHEAKPHAFGILFICLTLYFSLRLLEEKKNRFAFLGGASSGLVAGSLYPYGLFLLYPLLAGILQKRALHKILLVLLGFALLFSLTNFYLFLTPSEFIQEVKINKQILGSFSMKEFFSLLPALALLCGWILIPFSILGVILLWKDKKIFLLFVPPSLFSIIVLLIICGEKTSFPLGAKHFIFCLPVFVLFAVVTLRKLSQRSFYFGSISGLICGGIFLYLTISYLASFAADCSELNTRIISGRWINRHIPKSSSIGTIYRFSPYYAPPFCFARYKLIAITGWEGFQQEMLPKYLLLVEGPFFRWGIKLEKLLKNYRIFKMFKNPFNTPLSHANDSIYIYKRITKYPRQFLSL